MGRNSLLALVFLAARAMSAFEHAPHGARSIGLGGATVSVASDLWASYVNPACLSAIPGTNVTIEYLPALFGLQELKRGAISVGRPTPIGTFALSLSGFGFELYTEAVAGIAAAHEIHEGVVLGIGVRFCSLTIPGYGSDLAVGLDMGVLVHISREIAYGCALHNLNRPTIGSGEEALPQTMTMGVSFGFVSNTLVALSVGKDSRYSFRPSIGLEYSIEDVVSLRLGAEHEPSTVSAGIGIRTSLLSIDYAYTGHPDLGGTHCFSLSFVIS